LIIEQFGANQVPLPILTLPLISAHAVMIGPLQYDNRMHMHMVVDGALY